jgi:hypothetical protein
LVVEGEHRALDVLVRVVFQRRRQDRGTRVWPLRVAGKALGRCDAERLFEKQLS